MENRRTAGNIAAAAAYLLWGVLPLYWMLLNSVQPLLTVSFRVLFSTVFLSVILFSSAQRKELRSVFADKKLLLKFAASSALIFLNWTLFVWGVAAGWLLDVSFGYFMTPLMQVILGIVFLKEKLDAGSAVSFVLALAAIAYMMVAQGIFPWFSVALSALFAFYGLVKKRISTDVYAGLYVETLFMTPLCIAILAYFVLFGAVPFGGDFLTTTLLVLTGIATTVPMVFYNLAAKKLTMIALGFYQYLCPICMLLIGIFVSHDILEPYQIVSFALVWAALIIYSAASVIKRRKELKCEA
jgi:chloramphenicol-sensitive protein RarD